MGCCGLMDKASASYSHGPMGQGGNLSFSYLNKLYLDEDLTQSTLCAASWELQGKQERQIEEEEPAFQEMDTIQERQIWFVGRLSLLFPVRICVVV